MKDLIDRLHELLDRIFPAPGARPVPVRVKDREPKR